MVNTHIFSSSSPPLHFWYIYLTTNKCKNQGGVKKQEKRIDNEYQSYYVRCPSFTKIIPLQSIIAPFCKMVMVIPDSPIFAWAKQQFEFLLLAHDIKGIYVPVIIIHHDQTLLESSIVHCAWKIRTIDIA